MIAEIENLIRTADKFRNSYFWSPDKSAGARRSFEKNNSIPLFSWSEGGHEYTAEYTVQCSCKNIYAWGNYTKDGKKTTLTAIKNSLKRMKENEVTE